MRICLIGGIFGKPASYRAAVTATPETTLADGLRLRGHTVDTYGQDRAPGDLTDVDVVHAHHLARGTLHAAARRRRSRLVFTSHWFEHTSAVRRIAHRYVLSRADASIVLSRTEADWQHRTFPMISQAPRVIANGIDDSVFEFAPPPAAPQPGEPWRLLFVGQLSRFKGVHLLLDALAELTPRLPVELQLVYQVSTEKAALDAQARRLALSRVRFLGPRTPAELAALYASSHVLVLPSTGEALPLVISEALLVGRPVIGTDVGAVREQIGDYGAVVAPGDPQALARALEEVCATYQRLTDRAAAVSSAARSRYSVAAMLDAHEALYAELIERGRLRTRRDDLVDAAVRLALFVDGRRGFRTARPRAAAALQPQEQRHAKEER